MTSLPSLSPLNVIRVETALSRYPGPSARQARDASASRCGRRTPRERLTLRWEVSHNSKYGQPGPLAYKLDTLIVNRGSRRRAAPSRKSSSSGAFTTSAESLGSARGSPGDNIKKALYQNASAFITAKLRYKLLTGQRGTSKPGFTRYSVVFTGRKAPRRQAGRRGLPGPQRRVHASDQRGP